MVCDMKTNATYLQNFTGAQVNLLGQVWSKNLSPVT